MNADVTPSFVPVLSWLPGRARLARFLRLHPELEGSRSASNLLFRTMPRAGSGIATFEGGVALRCDFRSHYDRSVFTGREESTERRLLSCLLRPGDRFVDAGAHLGLHSLVAAARVGRAGRVFAFEPGREAFERLQGNVRASGFERQVEVVPRALSDETGLQVAPGGRCHDDMRGGDPDETDRAGAISITLDDALGGSAVAGMRIAARGHEMPVLLGALERSRPATRGCSWSSTPATRVSLDSKTGGATVTSRPPATKRTCQRPWSAPTSPPFPVHGRANSRT